MKIAEFLGLEWEGPEGPLIEPPRFSPVIADPSFLFPEEDPRGEWNLVAHSAWGIHRFSSKDGLAWADWGIVVRNGMRPFLRLLEGGRPGQADYTVLYEAYPPLALPLTALPLKRAWKSQIAARTSRDLVTWSPASVLARPELAWMADPALGGSVSNPCLVQAGPGDWRLYYSASLSWIEDCGFCEPRYLALAQARHPEGPFTPRAEPIVDPSADSLPGVLGAGSMKVLAFEDGWIGLQNKIYRDPRGQSRSAIFVLRSEDGLAWTPARTLPLLAPAISGWTSSHVYACDCRFRQEDGSWYLYFNARDGWRVSEGRERIGRLVARP